MLAAVGQRLIDTESAHGPVVNNSRRSDSHDYGRQSAQLQLGFAAGSSSFRLRLADLYCRGSVSCIWMGSGSAGDELSVRPGLYTSLGVRCALCCPRTMLWSSGKHRNVLIPTSQLHSVWSALEAVILMSVLVS